MTEKEVVKKGRKASNIIGYQTRLFVEDRRQRLALKRYDREKQNKTKTPN